MEKQEDKGSLKCTGHSEKELENYKSSCTELEERSKKWEERCATLELEIGNKRSEYELLDVRYKALEVEKIAIEDELEALKRKNSELEVKIGRTENESKIGGGGGETAEGRVVDLTFENDEKIVQLMIENKVLECEKKRAEDDAEVWKEKVRELESRMVSLENAGLVLRSEECAINGKKVASLENFKTDKMREVSKPKNEVSLDNVPSKEKAVDLNETFSVSPSQGFSQIPGTPYIDTHHKHSGHNKGEKHVRRQLVYRDGRSPYKNMAPSTPVGLRDTAGIIDISDSDDELDISKVSMPKMQGNVMVSVPANHVAGGAVGNEKGMNSGNSLNRTLVDQSDKEDSSGCKGNFPSSTTPKRKRVLNVVTTDSETDDDDDKVPICKLKKMHLQEPIHDPTISDLNNCSARANNITGSVSQRRGRLVSLRQCEEGSRVERNSPSNIKTSRTKSETGIPTTEDVDDETEEFESDSEGDNLDDFIVDSSSVSDTSSGNDVSDSSDDSNESDIVSDDNMDFGEILCTVKRNKNQKSNWEFEGDVLAALGKDDELCLKAVCALYRRQTSDEKIVKGTIHCNKRGFSQCDAPRGTTLAEFLLDGDPLGDLKKSVKELKAYDPEGVEKCRTLATRYSKQLFEIYKSKEDPYFRPS